MSSYKDVLLFIDGEWQAGAEQRTIQVVNPATEDVIGTVAHAERADLDAALAAAKKGFDKWKTVSAFERAGIMRKAAQCCASAPRISRN